MIAKGKIGQRASLELLGKIEELRAIAFDQLTPGEHEETRGVFAIQWRIANHTPFFGTKQIQCRVVYTPAMGVLAESVFYRSE